ncbi:MAG: tyrosine-type recombinase/integrase [Bacteroidota bacterium]
MAKKKGKRNLRKIGGIWYFRIQWNGKPIKRSLGVSREAAAKDLRDEYLANLVKYGQLDPPDENEGGITFGEFAKKWASIHKRDVKYSTWRDYKSAMNSRILPVFKDRPIKEISYMEILEFRNNLKVSAKRANNIMVPMKSAFEMAFREGIIPENVMRKIKKLREESPDIHPFSYAEINRILDAVDPWYRPYVQVAFYSGMRAGELNALKWSNYHGDLVNGPEIHIRKSYVYGKDGGVKTEKSVRNLPCLSEVVEAIEQQRLLTGDKEYIFLTRDGKRMNPDHFREVVWKPALEEAGIAYRPPIQTRHTYATMMLSAGYYPKIVQEWLGHSSLQMVYQRYASWIPGQTRTDGQLFRNYINELKKQKGQDEGSDPCEQGDVETEKTSPCCTKIVPLSAYRKK